MKLVLLFSVVLLFACSAYAAVPVTALDKSDDKTGTMESKDADIGIDEDVTSVVNFEPTVRAKGSKKVRFPKFCACKQLRGRRGRCYFFLKSKGYKCKARRCVRRYVCVSKKYLKKYLKKNGAGKKVTVCIKRVTKKTIVPVLRKGRKGYCKPMKTKKRIFYVPYVRK